MNLIFSDSLYFIIQNFHYMHTRLIQFADLIPFVKIHQSFVLYVISHSYTFIVVIYTA